MSLLVVFLELDVPLKAFGAHLALVLYQLMFQELVSAQ